LSPSALNHAYNLTFSGFEGSTQTAAVVEYDTFIDTDVQEYASHFGLPTPNVQRVLVNHACEICCKPLLCVSCKCKFKAPTVPGQDQAEVTLDIELILAVAHQVKVLVYIGPNLETLSVLNQVAQDNLAKTISNSWGNAESQLSRGYAQAENIIFKQMAAQGQSFFSSAGDKGAFDGPSSSKLEVDDPGSQPYVTCVGGTTLTLAKNGDYQSETTWWNPIFLQGGGGGISKIWPLPSYQFGFANSQNLGSTTYRNVPDVSLDADPNTGYAIYVGGSWAVYGGTSCAAPIWSAFTTLVNDYRESLSRPVLGFMNPLLYSIGSSNNYRFAFHDIADGSTNGHFPAVQGYDLATGLGSINGGALFYALGGCSNPKKALSNGVCQPTGPTDAPVPQPTVAPTQTTAFPPTKKKHHHPHHPHHRHHG